MVNSELNLQETKHPAKEAEKRYELLIGIDEQKTELLKTLSLLMDIDKVHHWEKHHHKKGLPLMQHIETGTPLIILSGEVGCGKTALAQVIGTPLAKKLSKPVKAFETPSNVRGSGLVGEISNRITETFESVKAKLKHDEVGILIIDEADDIATSRAQNQAHHEDRAGLNVLIKQIDSIKRANKKLAVIMITNRVVVLDPAVRRRTSLHLIFERPTGEKLDEVLAWLVDGTNYTDAQFKKLKSVASKQKIPYSFSDLIQRAGRQAIFHAIENNVAFDITLFSEVLEKTHPTPLIEEQKIN
jgi:SpoVK/Ycf46/Vps4 family AAA+-type ATPase